MHLMHKRNWFEPPPLTSIFIVWCMWNERINIRVVQRGAGRTRETCGGYYLMSNNLSHLESPLSHLLWLWFLLSNVCGIDKWMNINVIQTEVERARETSDRYYLMNANLSHLESPLNHLLWLRFTSSNVCKNEWYKYIYTLRFDLNYLKQYQ